MTACFHLHTDFVRQCVHLPGAGTGRDHEKVHDRRNTGQIEDNGVFTTILFAQLGNVAGVFQTALQSVLGTGGGDGGGNSKLQGSNQNSQGILSICGRFTPNSGDDAEHNRTLSFANSLADNARLYEVHPKVQVHCLEVRIAT